MSFNSIERKIQKYTHKLSRSTTRDRANLYQQKLRYYYNLNQSGGVDAQEILDGLGEIGKAGEVMMKKIKANEEEIKACQEGMDISAADKGLLDILKAEKQKLDEELEDLKEKLNKERQNVENLGKIIITKEDTIDELEKSQVNKEQIIEEALTPIKSRVDDVLAEILKMEGGCGGGGGACGLPFLPMLGGATLEEILKEFTEEQNVLKLTDQLEIKEQLTEKEKENNSQLQKLLDQQMDRIKGYFKEDNITGKEYCGLDKDLQDKKDKLLLQQEEKLEEQMKNLKKELELLEGGCGGTCGLPLLPMYGGESVRMEEIKKDIIKLEKKISDQKGIWSYFNKWKLGRELKEEKDDLKKELEKERKEAEKKEKETKEEEDLQKRIKKQTPEKIKEIENLEKEATDLIGLSRFSLSKEEKIKLEDLEKKIKELRYDIGLPEQEGGCGGACGLPLLPMYSEY